MNSVIGIILILSYLVSLVFLPQATAQTHKIRVALYVDRGASGPAKKNFRNVLDMGDDLRYDPIYGDDIGRGALKNYDVLIVPGGNASRDAFTLGSDAREEVRRFVKQGGIYMGICAGAYLASRSNDDFIGMLPMKTLDPKHWYRVDEGTRVDLELTPTGMDVFGLKSREISIVYENGPIFAPLTDDKLIPLGYFRSEVVGRGGERGVMLGAPAMVMSRYGQGIVLVISPHPEKTPGYKRMILHALNWLYDHRTDGN
jgi:putative intracellular protease/amidase